MKNQIKRSLPVLIVLLVTMLLVSAVAHADRGKEKFALEIRESTEMIAGSIFCQVNTGSNDMRASYNISVATGNIIGGGDRIFLDNLRAGTSSDDAQSVALSLKEKAESLGCSVGVLNEFTDPHFGGPPSYRANFVCEDKRDGIINILGALAIHVYSLPVSE